MNEYTTENPADGVRIIIDETQTSSLEEMRALLGRMNTENSVMTLSADTENETENPLSQFVNNQMKTLPVSAKPRSSFVDLIYGSGLNNNG